HDDESILRKNVPGYLTQLVGTESADVDAIGDMSNFPWIYSLCLYGRSDSPSDGEDPGGGPVGPPFQRLGHANGDRVRERADGDRHVRPEIGNAEHKTGVFESRNNHSRCRHEKRRRLGDDDINLANT